MANQCVLVTFNKKACENAAFLEVVSFLHSHFDKVCFQPPDKVSEDDLAAAHFWVAGGGDGTLNGVVNRLMKSKPTERVPLCYLPSGTGNDFARSIRLSEFTPLQILEGMVQKPRLRQVTVAGCNEEYFINVATGGLFATITPDANAQIKSFAGRWSYALSGLTKMKERESLPMTINGNERVEVLGFFIGNAPYAGGGVQVAPEADPFDDRLEFVAIPNMPTADLISLGLEMQKEAPELQDRPILQRRVQDLQLSFEKETPINLDGEQIKVLESRFTVHPKAISIHVPEVD